MTKVKCLFVALCSVRESDFAGGQGPENEVHEYQILYYTSMKYCDMIGQLKGVYFTYTPVNFTYTPVKFHLYTCKFHVVTASYIKHHS